MKKPPRSRNLYRMGLLETFCIIAAEDYGVYAFLNNDSLVFDDISYLYKVQR